MNLHAKLFALILVLSCLLSVTGCASAPETASAPATVEPLEGCQAQHMSPRPADQPNAVPVWMAARPGPEFVAVWLAPEQAQVLSERQRAQQDLPQVLADLERYRRGLALWQSTPEGTADRAGNIGLCETRIRELEAMRTRLRYQLGQTNAESNEPENFLRASTRK